MLDKTPFYDSDAIAVKSDFATKNSLDSVADLKKLGKGLKIGAPPEFKTRYEGLIGLKQQYGVNPTFLPLAIGLQYKALDDGKIQAADVFTTDGQLQAAKYKVLKDPKFIFGFQNVAPVISQKVLRRPGHGLLGRPQRREREAHDGGDAEDECGCRPRQAEACRGRQAVPPGQRPRLVVRAASPALKRAAQRVDASRVVQHVADFLYAMPPFPLMLVLRGDRRAAARPDPRARGTRWPRYGAPTDPSFVRPRAPGSGRWSAARGPLLDGGGSERARPRRRLLRVRRAEHRPSEPRLRRDQRPARLARRCRHDSAALGARPVACSATRSQPATVGGAIAGIVNALPLTFRGNSQGVEHVRQARWALHALDALRGPPRY